MLETHYECPCLDKCPLSYAMSIIGGKWKMQIICALNNRGTLRYNELRRKMDGISNTVLASSLRELEDTCDRLALLHDGKIAFDGDIQSIRTSLIKIQTAFDGDFSREVFDGIEILSLKKHGRVYELIARGDKERITEAVRLRNPLFLELMPLSLEEIFIHETAALGYSFDEVRTDETK